MPSTSCRGRDLHLVDAGGGCGLGGAGLWGRKIEGTNVTASFVDAEKRLDVTNLTVAADCDWAIVVRSGLTRLTDSVVGGGQEVDVVSRRRPLFVNVSCGTSRRYDAKTGAATSETWGACAND